ncbi:MAG: hypothetical protein J3Q66DRAFT_406781 [Benniella sp.]|nr:MAG: hypothetical protein J3Q66DRAFT_406781 [Benniella sp.]
MKDFLVAVLPGLLASLSSLQSLELDVPYMRVENLLSVLDACPSSLQHLDLGSHLQRRITVQDSIAHPNHSPTTTATSIRLKRLRIRGVCSRDTLEDILSHLAAHSLEELLLDSVLPHRTSSILRGALWRLTNLCLVAGNYGHEKVLPQIMDAIHPHHLRHVYLGDVDTESIAKLIGEQHGSLETLKLTFAQDHAAVLADVLARCTKLKKLIFTSQPFVDVRALIDPQRPWVCFDLEVFDGHFGLTCRPLLRSGSKEKIDVERLRQIENQFMQRLGQLVKLRKLV